MPPELAALRLRLVRAEALPTDQREALLAQLRTIQRPPRSMHKLLSAEFLASASSVELGELLKEEPPIAARVLGAVNSPMYGLKVPVTSVGQAVTFLGLNTLRSVFLQYMLAASFQPTGPQQQQLFDTIWKSSAIAAELCAKLSQQLSMREQATLVTQVVLYFLGHLATFSMLPKEDINSLWEQGLLERMQSEQDRLGLCATEIGALLMQAWGLPEAIVADVRDIDRVLDTPANEIDTPRRPRLALCYLSVRLGKRLARGLPIDASSLDALEAEGAEFHHLRSYTQHPRLAALPEALQSRPWQAAIAQVQANNPSAAPTPPAPPATSAASAT